MKNSSKIALIAGAVVGGAAIAAHVMKKKAEKTTYKAEVVEPIEERTMGFYEKYGKRVFDIACATAAITVCAPIYVGVAFLVKTKLGSPVLFTQDRPGMIDKDGKETVFKMYKFRTMTDERDENGELLPDEVRLTKFGKWLRNTSLDELPEAFNILNGTMSVIGPRPQLVRDMTFMTKEQRSRHTAKPGLSGLAQVNGRNGISWEEKLEWDQKYIQKVSLAEDVRIIIDTVKKAFIKQEGITQDDMATTEDFGDYLLRTGKVTEAEYEENQKLSRKILDKTSIETVQLDSFDFSVSMCVYGGDDSEAFKIALDSIAEQTLKPNEIVLTVDGPIPDETEIAIKNFESKCEKYNISFVVIRLKENMGHGIARRTGLSECSNELVALMDSDDISETDRFQKQIEYFTNNPNTTIVGGQITEFVSQEDKGNISEKAGKRIVPLDNRSLMDYMRKRCPMNQMTVMFKKSDVMAVGGYQDWYCDEDYYLWIRLALAGFKFANLEDNLVNVRVGKEMYQRRGGIKYFKSEAKLQKLMFDKKIINAHRYAINVSERLVLQVLMPNKLRGYIFKQLARNK